jgi:hypothetical protein
LYRKHKETPATRRNRRHRRRRPNLRRQISLARNPNTWFKGKPQVTSIHYQPPTWKHGYRFVIKRTPIVDKNGQQMLDDGWRKYSYHVIVTNSRCSDSAVMGIAQQRGNQENLIKDLKYGLGLSHVPTGSLNANKAYFLIAALGWNLKTWMLNLLQLGNGAVMRFKRFLYLWIKHAARVVVTARNTVVVKLSRGDYFRRFGRALVRASV